ncbi:hypothetical protein J6590_027104 [Homalodisca vitripennis]|nr:hypothetical protein J6590_027104 [Homalodisca vitripennis]
MENNNKQTKMEKDEKRRGWDNRKSSSIHTTNLNALCLWPRTDKTGAGPGPRSTRHPANEWSDLGHFDYRVGPPCHSLYRLGTSSSLVQMGLNQPDAHTRLSCFTKR